MTNKDFIDNLEKTYEDCIEIVKKKNADYATEIDPYKNFRFATLFDVSVEKAILVRISDKMARINNVLNKDGLTAVKDETLLDTLNDAINYLAILKAYLTT